METLAKALRERGDGAGTRRITGEESCARAKKKNKWRATVQRWGPRQREEQRAFGEHERSAVEGRWDGEK